MLAAVTSLVLHSLLIVLVTTVLFWAVVGGAAARRTSRPVTTGLAVGGLLPGLGALLLLVSRARTRSAEPSTGDVGRLAPSLPLSGPPLSGLPLSGLPLSGLPLSGLPLSGATRVPAGPVPLTPGPPPPLPGVPPPFPGPLPGSVPAYDRTSVRLPADLSGLVPPAPEPGSGLRTWQLRRLTAGDLARSALAGTAAVLLVAAAVVPWYSVHTPVVDAGAFVDHGLVAPVPCLLGALALVAVAIGHVLRPRGTWPVLAAAVGATSLLVSLQVLLVTEAIGRVVQHWARTLPRGASLRPAPGAFLLLAAGLLALAWATTSLFTCPATSGAPALAAPPNHRRSR